MDVKIYQLWDCSGACRFLTKWFVFSSFALIYSLHVRGCTNSLHDIGEDVHLNCKLIEEITNDSNAFCRKVSGFQYKVDQQDEKYGVIFDNASNIVTFTIAYVTEEDFMVYECGARYSETARINWTCCFNLIQVTNISPSASSMTSLVRSTADTITSQDDGNTNISTTQPVTEDLNNASTGCVAQIPLESRSKFKNICKMKKMSYEGVNYVTVNCLEHLVSNNGTGGVPVIIFYGGKSCNVTCYTRFDVKCVVTSPEKLVATTGQGLTLSKATGQTNAVPSKIQKDYDGNEGDSNVVTVIFILCGVMIVLILLIAGLCLYLCCSGKKTSKTQQTPIYSHTLGVVKIEFQAQNSSTSNSNPEGLEERDRNQNDEEKDPNIQNLVSETSGWEDNIAYEAFVNSIEGDYADVNDKHLLNENETTLSVIDKGSKETTCNSNSNLYESVINKGE